jgi:hypothetical protein
MTLVQSGQRGSILAIADPAPVANRIARSEDVTTFHTHCRSIRAQSSRSLYQRHERLKWRRATYVMAFKVPQRIRIGATHRLRRCSLWLAEELRQLDPKAALPHDVSRNRDGGRDRPRE